MSNLHDLDLTTIDSDGEENQKKLVAKIESFYNQDTLQRSALAYSWERNHLMLDGQQWLIYEGNRESGGLWRKLQPSPSNEYIPRPVTNYLFDAYQTLKGYMLKNDVRSTVRPNTQTNKDKTAAKIAELVNECNWERLHEEENYEYGLSNLLTYGTVFKKDYWDSSTLNTVKVPRMEVRPVIDPNTGAPTGQTEEVQAMDPTTGYPAYDELPLGDISTTIIEPYKMTMDPLATSTHNPRWIMEFAIQPLSWIVENFDQAGDGYTGKAKEVKAEKALPSSLRRFFQLKTSPGVKGTLNPALASTAGYGDDQMINEGAIVKEYYERPTRKNPKGRLIVVANGVCLYAGPSPYSGPEQGDWHPYSECRWELVPGRFWGKSPFDDTVEIQKQINSIDSIIILTRKTMAVPQKLVPRGTIPVGDVWTGQPGQKVSYTPGPNGEAPSTIPASGVDGSVFQERSQRVEDLKNITGAIDILKGDRPPGVTAYSALSLLFEVGTGKLAPIMKRWKKFIENSQKKQLKLVASKYREPRPEFIRTLMSKNKDLSPEQIHSFIGTDLNDNCNVIIEASSAVPKLLAAEHAKLMELAQLGVLNLENPANKAEFLDRFGIVGFNQGYGKDAEKAQWENDILENLENSGDNTAIRLDSDDDNVHIEVHKDRTKEPSFMHLPFATQKAFFDHIKVHEDAQAQAQQMQMMQAAMMGQPPQPPPPNPMQQQENIRKGPGPTSKVKNAIASDITGPFGGITK